MCGLVALIDPNGGVQTSALSKMAAAIAHRGPDGEGFVLFDGESAYPMVGPNAPQGGGQDLQEVAQARVGLGHRRLSIVDVSETGHQPMVCAQARYWVTYNGEIYNHLELRTELEALGHVFRSHSDTEVLLAAWAEWGASALNRLNGMFAFVLYDTQADELIAVRDRFGVKPLYFWSSPSGTMAFASEIKAFSVLDGWRAVLNGQMAYDFLVWGLTDHCGATLFDGVEQVRPGELLRMKVTDSVIERETWFTPTPDQDTPSDFAAAARTFKDKFTDAVRLRLRADVPVGTALSGGLDSSSIVCTVHDLWDGDDDHGRNAFSARTKDADFDEGPFMDVVAQQTDVLHHVTWPDADGFLKDLPDMIWHHDEPFSSASIYAEWKVFAKVAETPVKVTLDGHGADETLAGYTAFIGPHFGALARAGRLTCILKEWRAQRALHNRSPLWMMAMLVDDLSPNWLRGLLRKITGRTHPRPAWINIQGLQVRADDPFAKSGGRGHGVLGLSLAQLSKTSLPMQLKWADRDSMAHSIESREPFLDPDLVGYILGLEDGFKLKGGVSKRVLREGLKGVLPQLIAQRMDKMGFVTPESLWVTRDRPEAFLEAAKEAVENSQGVLTSAALDDARAMIGGEIPFHTRLIRMIAFGAWMKRFDVEVQSV